MTEHKWWQKAIFYQIYPRSFADGNGDGIGDFPGITSKLDYLVELGIDAIWLSPHFPSPNWDCGYDISDYENVAPEYGNLNDFKTFLREAHARDLRVILDLVLNHTSDEHPWFIESKSSRTNPKSDWYVWVDSPPNNWQSCFDGEAWTYSPERGQYYYHYFMKQQPDLNWKNPAVKNAMWAAVRFWLDMGVDGFRLDAIGTIFEDPSLTNHSVPMNLAELRHATDLAQTHAEKRKILKYWNEMFKFQFGQPGVHEVMKKLRSVLDEYDGDRMLVGEDDDLRYHGNGHDELHMVFNFPLMKTDRLTPAHIRKNQRERNAALAEISLEAWPCNTLGNHDCSRVLSRYGDGFHSAELARLSLALILTLKGTPFLYYGEEIGMTDYLLTDISHVRDTMGSWYYHAAVHELGVDPDEAMKRTAAMTRDKNRTPMHWTNSANGGFCPASAIPWLPVNPNYAEGINVKEQLHDPLSMLSFYKRLIFTRKNTPALVTGDYRPLHDRSSEYLAFLRVADHQSVLVILNYSEKHQTLHFPKLTYKKSHLIFSSTGRCNKEESLSGISVGPFEIYIAELS
jgi:alpha-glucosidase